MAKKIQKEEACPKARPDERDDILKVTDEDGTVHFVPKDEKNRDYRAVLEFRRGKGS